MCPPFYEAIFHFPRVMENYYLSGERLFWQTRQLNQRPPQYFFLLKDLTREGIWTRDPWIYSLALYQLSYQGYAEICVNLLKFKFQKRKNKDDKIVCNNPKQDTGFEPGTLGSTVWCSINWAIGARQNFRSISWNLTFKRKKIKDNKIISDNI